MSSSVIPTSVLQEVMDAMDDMATDSRLLDMKQSRIHQFDAARDALRAAMEQPDAGIPATAQNPYRNADEGLYGPEYTGQVPVAERTRPSSIRQRTPLTDEQVDAIVANHRLNVGNWSKNGASVAGAIEYAHNIK